MDVKMGKNLYILFVLGVPHGSVLGHFQSHQDVHLYADDTGDFIQLHQDNCLRANDSGDYL